MAGFQYLILSRSISVEPVSASGGERKNKEPVK